MIQQQLFQTNSAFTKSAAANDVPDRTDAAGNEVHDRANAISGKATSHRRQSRLANAGTISRGGTAAAAEGVGTATGTARLELGEVRHVAEVVLNGTDLGRRSWSPYRFDVTSILRRGRNELIVRVGNTPADVYWSAENVAGQKAARRWNIYGQRIRERCRPDLGGGLLGPARLITKV